MFIKYICTEEVHEINFNKLKGSLAAKCLRPLVLLEDGCVETTDGCYESINT